MGKRMEPRVCSMNIHLCFSKIWETFEPQKRSGGSIKYNSSATCEQVCWMKGIRCVKGLGVSGVNKFISNLLVYIYIITHYRGLRNHKLPESSRNISDNKGLTNLENALGILHLPSINAVSIGTYKEKETDHCNQIQQPISIITYP